MLLHYQRDLDIIELVLDDDWVGQVWCREWNLDMALAVCCTFTEQRRRPSAPRFLADRSGLDHDMHVCQGRAHIIGRLNLGEFGVT